jgi:acetyl esterase/lipase
MGRRTGLLAALGALLSGCSAAGVLNTLVPDNTYRGREGVAYGRNPRQQLDVYQPLAPPQRGKPPLVVFFYGGNWKAGERGDYRFVGEALASRGAIVVIPDYRLFPEVRYPDFLVDSAAAVKWAFDHAAQLGGDPANVHVMGHSAGAYNAAMLALDPRWLGSQRDQLAGFIGIAGPYDFLPIVNPDTQRAFNWPDTPAESQPLRQVTAGAPRTLLLAATKDDLVNPQRNTVQLGERLQAAGVQTRVQLFDGVSHVTVIGAVARPLRRLAPVLPEVLAFLRVDLEGGRAAARPRRHDSFQWLRPFRKQLRHTRLQRQQPGAGAGDHGSGQETDAPVILQASPRRPQVRRREPSSST